MARRPIRNEFILYVVDTYQISDPLCREINYNLLEGSVRHDIAYKYFTNYEEAFNSLKTEDIKYAIFTKPSGTFDPYYLRELIQKNLRGYSLIGHLLDKKDEYYELHEQCFVINVEAYNAVGLPAYNGGSDAELQNVSRSEETFHDNYTPLRVFAAEGKSMFKNIKDGALIISKLLEHGYNIRPWTEEERKHKFYLYNDITLKYGSYLRIETNMTDTVFNCATEPLISETMPTVQKIITPANGLQALAIVDRCTNLHTIDFKDINSKQLEFTQKLIQEYNGQDFADFCYSTGLELHDNDRDKMDRYEKQFLENLTTDWHTLKQKLNNLNIFFNRESFFEIEQFVNNIEQECTTLYNFSNILSYRKTYYLYSQIHFNLMLKVLAHNERLAGNKSFIRGILPSSEVENGFKTSSVNDFTLDPDPILDYEWRTELYEYYKNYLKVLRKAEIRKSLQQSN